MAKKRISTDMNKHIYVVVKVNKIQENYLSGASPFPTPIGVAPSLPSKDFR